LKTLKENPTYGYNIIGLIRRRFGVYFGASTIYPALASMEKRGLVISRWVAEGKRPHKLYTLTSKGERMLFEDCLEIRAIAQPFIEMSVSA
jgi:DNA-binding PadR family transcriptional regulator